MSDDLDTLCADYLEQLRVALGDVQSSDREQIIAQVGEHLSEARAALPNQDETGVRQILERLGLPEDIAAAAIADRKTEHQAKHSSLLVWAAVGVLAARLLSASRLSRALSAADQAVRLLLHMRFA